MQHIEKAATAFSTAVMAGRRLQRRQEHDPNVNHDATILEEFKMSTTEMLRKYTSLMNFVADQG